MMFPYSMNPKKRNRLLLEDLHSSIDEWRTQFEHVPTTKLEFSIDRSDMLLFNGISICPASHIFAPESLTCDCEVFTLRTNAGDIFEFYIEWPYQKEGAATVEPYLSGISKFCNLYTCTDHSEDTADVTGQ